MNRRAALAPLIFLLGLSFAAPVRAGEADDVEAAVLAIEEAFVGAVRAIRPSVVAITVAGLDAPAPEPAPRDPDEPVRPRAEERREPVPEGGMGSGVIVSADGYVLTNHHVAGSARSVRVTLLSGKRVPATLVGTNPRGDLTLLKIPGEGHPFCEIGPDTGPEPGAWAIAMGNPFTLGADGSSVVTLGVVSGLHRVQPGTSEGDLFYGSAIQTDAEINPGSSGGPLFDIHGRLIGINGRIANARGHRVNAGVGFAISARQIRRFLPALKRGGQVSHGFLGVRYATKEVDARGIEVTFVFPGSPADEAGLEAADRITSFDGVPITSGVRFAAVMSTLPEGAAVAIEARRDARELALDAKLARRPTAEDGAR